MDNLLEKKVLKEIKNDDNFGFLLEGTVALNNTDYKVLQSQTSGIFIPCMKMLYNGKIELFYVVDEYRAMTSILSGMMPDTFMNIVINLLSNVIDIRNNGFLSCENIDMSWDRIYVDTNTLKVRMIYLPINQKLFDNYSSFESELRSSIVKLINQYITISNPRLDSFVQDLCSGTLSLDDVYNKSRGAGNSIVTALSNQRTFNQNTASVQMRSGQIGNMKMVAMNAPCYFEITLDRDVMTLGKKVGYADTVIPYNAMISRKHCSIAKHSGRYYITDTGSANGTFVNHNRLLLNQPCMINKGDIIRLADSDFQLV